VKRDRYVYPKKKYNSIEQHTGNREIEEYLVALCTIRWGENMPDLELSEMEDNTKEGNNIKDMT
jgi:hypothetical protein